MYAFLRNQPAEDRPLSLVKSQGLLERILELDILELLGLSPGGGQDDLSGPVRPHSRLHVLLLVIWLTVVL